MRWPAFLRIAASAGPGARLFHGAAALSKQLRVLEAQLGAVLIQRTTRRMSL
jgi:DNA-binding transcriptional LysR family regulator